MKKCVFTIAINIAALAYADTSCCIPECCKNYPSSSRIQPECSYANLYVEGDPLYWRPTDANLYMAVSGRNPIPTPLNAPVVTTDFDGHIVRVKPDWDWGFHLALGGNLPTDEWDLQIDWTRFHTEDSHSEGDPTAVFENLWATSDRTTSAASAFVTGTYHLRYDLLEINMGRHFWVGDRLSIHPNFGVRGGWINQKFLIDYTVFTLGSTSGNKTPFSAPGPGVDISTKSNFHGGGIGAGADVDFDLFKGLAILAKLKLHALYGEYHNKFQETTQEANLLPLLAFEEDNYHHSLFGTDIALGLSWNRTFSDERFNLELHALWQQVIWAAANQIDHWTTQLHKSDMNKFNSKLSLQGITFGASVHF